MSELTYTMNGDYLLPNLTLPQQSETTLNKYGRMRKTYLKEHRPVLWNRMLLNGTLDSHLQEISEAASRRLNQMMQEMAAAQEVTEELKARDPMSWTQQMNSLKAQAEEVILTELVFS